MRCPACGYGDNKVLETRSIEDDTVIRRRRECLSCAFRFNTYESVGSTQLMVCKRDNTREPFDRKKIMNGLLKACQKRPVSTRQMEKLIDSIEAECQNSPSGEVTTEYIGQRLMAGLRALDEVAYVRFISVYRQFEDIDSFLDELNDMKRMKIEKMAKDKKTETPQ